VFFLSPSQIGFDQSAFCFWLILVGLVHGVWLDLEGGVFLEISIVFGLI